MRRYRRHILVAAAAMSLLPNAIAFGADEAKEKPAEKAAAAEAPLPAVLVAPVERRALGEETEFVGRVQAFEKVDLRARVTGFLREKKFEAGQQVKEGEVLYQIEREPFEATLDQQRALLASAQATLDNADVTVKRYQQLESRQFASTASLDSAVADQKRAMASIQQSKAAIESATIQLSYTTIVAPISGRIGRTAIDPGNLVTPESGVLATIVRSDKMYVLFPVTQAQLLEARKDGSTPENLKVRARLADNSFVKDLGVIDFLDVTVDSRTDGQIVRALFPNPDNVLTDGQTVRVSIERKDPPTVDAIPVSAVSTDQAGPYVFVVGPDDTVEQRRVQLGEGREGFVVVKDGLKTGDLVIVQGIQKVRPGVKVSAKLATDASGSNNGETK